jgi:hypothetical protein
MVLGVAKEMIEGIRAVRGGSYAGKVFFISFCLILSVPLYQASDTSNAINKYKDLQSNFSLFKDNFIDARPESVCLFPKTNLPSLFPAMSVSPINEQISMSGEDSKRQVRDIKAINSDVRRTIEYGDVQMSQGLDQANSMNIGILGMAKENDSQMDLNDDFEEMENDVDAVPSGRIIELANRSNPAYVQSNNLNIIVRDISVTAINTMDRGIATAISNIIIEPVQIINPSEVCEKLR